MTRWCAKGDADKVIWMTDTELWQVMQGAVVVAGELAPAELAFSGVLAVAWAAFADVGDRGD